MNSNEILLKLKYTCQNWGELEKAFHELTTVKITVTEKTKQTMIPVHRW